DTEGLVAAKLDQLAVEGEDRLPCKLGEARGEPTCFLVAVLLCEARIAANVGDQERQDRGRSGHAGRTGSRSLVLTPAHAFVSYEEGSTDPSAGRVLIQVWEAPTRASPSAARPSSKRRRSVGPVSRAVGAQTQLRGDRIGDSRDVVALCVRRGHCGQVERPGIRIRVLRDLVRAD